MDASFWHDKWEKGEIAFHEGRANALLVQHLKRLNLDVGARVLLPLCGKTEDIPWLMQQGYRVVGAELSELAVKDLFTGLASRFGIRPEITQVGDLRHYQAEGVEIWVGDIFDLSPETLGAVDMVYDRAALVAMPETLRSNYSAHLMHLAKGAPQLLITLEYRQSELKGPPFSIDRKEVEEQYGDHYTLRQLEQRVVEGRLKGKVDAVETAWLLLPR